MSDDDVQEAGGAHGVHGAARGDGRMQEEPTGSEQDEQGWADATDTGGQAAS